LNKSSTNIAIVAVYVDDILIIGFNQHEIDHVKQDLDLRFYIKDPGALHYFLGLEVTHLQEGIVLIQKMISHGLLKDAAISDLKPMATSLPIHCKFTYKGTPIEDPTYSRIIWGN